ncbi:MULTISPECIES: hypothetical protein [Cyanophyceae]|uniref:hypothetical protein n=1 Tax=Cyanophyceae TaxID=3028117 RepID=UPI0018F028C6|nr:hypothetical protein [Trichocoleus sp. FACHB-40]
MVKIPFQQESGAIPPLENGDRLNRYEFERCYKPHPQERWWGKVRDETLSKG